MREIIRYMLKRKMTFRSFILWLGVAAMIWLTVATVYRIYQIATFLAENAASVMLLVGSCS